MDNNIINGTFKVNAEVLEILDKNNKRHILKRNDTGNIADFPAEMLFWLATNSYPDIRNKLAQGDYNKYKQEDLEYEHIHDSIAKVIMVHAQRTPGLKSTITLIPPQGEDIETLATKLEEASPKPKNTKEKTTSKQLIK